MRDRRGNHDRRPPAKETSERACMCDAHWRERPAGELGSASVMAIIFRPRAQRRDARTMMMSLDEREN